jgi:hypothetical protein
MQKRRNKPRRRRRRRRKIKRWKRDRVDEEKKKWFSSSYLRALPGLNSPFLPNLFTIELKPDSSGTILKSGTKVGDNHLN